MTLSVTACDNVSFPFISDEILMAGAIVVLPTTFCGQKEPCTEVRGLSSMTLAEMELYIFDKILLLPSPKIVHSAMDIMSSTTTIKNKPLYLQNDNIRLKCHDV